MDVNKIPLLTPKLKYYKANKGIWLMINSQWFPLKQIEGLILSLCNGTNTLEEIIQYIAEIYNKNSKVVEVDIINFINKFYELGAIQFLPKKIKHPLSVLPLQKMLFRPDLENDYFYSEHIDSLGIILTEYCPLNCYYCFAGNRVNSTKNNFIPKENVFKLIETFKKMKGREIILSGGEPFSHPNIFDFIKKIIDNDLEITISTKGTLLNKSKIKKLKKLGLSRIQVSVDSLVPKTLKTMVGMDIYNKIYNTLFLLATNAIKVEARITLTKDNITEIKNLIIKLIKLGVYVIDITPVFLIGKANLDLLPEERQINIIQEIIKKYNQKFEELNLSFNYFKHGDLQCAGGRLSAFVFPNGDVTFCDLLGSYRNSFLLGNIFEKNFKKIWTSSTANYLRTIKGRTNSEKCFTCEKKENCLGGCRVIPLMFENTPKGKDLRCTKLLEKPELKGEYMNIKKLI